MSKNLIKPMENEDIRGGSRSKKWSQLDIACPQKHQKSIGKTSILRPRKSYAKYLIKPVVYGDFWGPFRENGPKSIQKALLL
jgi:hypothetical protein